MLICKIRGSFGQPESQPDTARAKLVASDPILRQLRWSKESEDGSLCSIVYLELGYSCDQSFDDLPRQSDKEVLTELLWRNGV